MQCIAIPKSKFTMLLGEVSYEIYLLHGIFITFLRSNTIFITSDYVYILFVCLLTIISAFIFHNILNKKNLFNENTTIR